MDFRIADTFTASLAKLTGDEQKAVKTTAFDLQMNPANPGLRFHKLDRAKDKSFWSMRVSRDIRIIVHRTDSSLMLCYVDHHDPAYDWAERRRIERHPRTGAAQLVEVRETVREIEVPVYVEAEQPARSVEPKPALLAEISDDQLLSYGVPADWLADAKAVDEDTLFDLVERLPQEAGEALLELATGGVPQPAVATTVEDDPFEHPDAERRFRLMTDSEELARALESPWEKWSVFLHPDQREAVERDYSGPARVAGSAGTGKTVVALHRAVHLARQHPDSRVLLTTFSITLANQLRRKMAHLAENESGVAERLTVRAIDEVGLDVYESQYGKPRVATSKMVTTILEQLCEEADVGRFSPRFIEREWVDVVDAWQLTTWESYRDVVRLGRKTRLGEKQRDQLWLVFVELRDRLVERGLVTMPVVFAAATDALSDPNVSPAEFAVVDEAQDVSVAQLRFLAALAGDQANGLFFAGDLGQRIFQTPFSWRSLGVDVRGRSTLLRVNYRTSHQIRSQADRLLPNDLSDVDGNTEFRAGTVSAFGGPQPVIQVCDDIDAEVDLVGRWVADRLAEGIPAHEIAIAVRSGQELSRARSAASAAGMKARILDRLSEPLPDQVSLVTMHLAKGLEFRAIAVMACDDEVIPLQSRVEGIGDEAELENMYETERHLLYVACTRARDHLLVSGVDPASEFLDDLHG